MKKFAIAIDGPAGSGKSTVAKIWQKSSALFILILGQCTEPLLLAV